MKKSTIIIFLLMPVYCWIVIAVVSIIVIGVSYIFPCETIYFFEIEKDRLAILAISAMVLLIPSLIPFIFREEIDEKDNLQITTNNMATIYLTNSEEIKIEESVDEIVKFFSMTIGNDSKQYFIKVTKYNENDINDTLKKEKMLVNVEKIIYIKETI